MFDLAELYAVWTEDPTSFWGQPDPTAEELQERLVVEPASILDEEVWSQVLAVACPPPNEAQDDAREWLGTLITCLRTWSTLASEAGGNTEAADSSREALEKYFFLTRLHLARLDDSLDGVVPTNKRTGSLGPIGEQIKVLIDAISRTVQGGVGAAFPATASAKRSTLALLYLEPSCRLLQREAVVKDTSITRELVRLLSLGVKLQHQQAMIRTQLLQLLTYYEHAVPVVVQLLDTLQKQFDHVSLTELVLKDLASEASEWSDTQNSATITRAKCVNAFLQALTHSMPHVVASNLSSISLLIRSPVPQLRQAVLDIAAPTIRSIITPDGSNARQPSALEELGANVPTSNLENLAIDNSGSLSQHANAAGAGFGQLDDSSPLRFKPAFDLIRLVEIRVNDVSHFCRLRAVQVLAAIVDEPALISCRERFTEIAVAKMKDRTQLVRKQAMRLMKQLIDTHPRVMHEGCLSRQVWESSLDQINSQLDQIEPGETRQQLEAAQAYVSFTLRFIEKVDDSVEVARMLLLSRSKSDILDAIELLVYADAYNVSSSAAGIRAMVHLVWAKADNDEGNAVGEAVVATYHELFMTAPPEFDTRRGAQLIAENLISLTNGANQGELTSLERLLVLAVEADYISVAVVGRLWGIYQTNSDIDPSKRRGAAILLSMLSVADRSIACSGISSVAKIGLGAAGKNDLELATYSCAILKRSIDSETGQRLPHNFELFDRLISFLLVPVEESSSMSWISFAKEALMAINVMCDCPPKVYTRLIRQNAANVFGGSSEEYSSSQRMQLFAQLLFLVGEVALNLLVYLERSELEFKRKSQELNQRGHQGQHGQQVQHGHQEQQESQNGSEQEADNEENLMAGGGSSGEDDFQDILRDVREDGIIYSDKALLKPFAQVVIEICERELKRSAADSQNNSNSGADDVDVSNAVEGADGANAADGLNVTNDADGLTGTITASEGDKLATDPTNNKNSLMIIGATQTLSKLMCVSSRFCADNLPLLVSLMSAHPSNIVRSNFVIALGDVAICFNRLIDQHTEYLYDRLNDKDSTVQRTCIVALTFLILAGQIKVKGKLGEMAKAVANPNRKISTLAIMFFRELATKENAIYNSFLDMLSTLISDAALPEPDMLHILKFLAEFIDRERHMKQLTEKLVARLLRCDSQRSWNAYVQVLKSMPRKLDDDVKVLISNGFTNITRNHEAMDVSEAEENDLEEPGVDEQQSPVRNTEQQQQQHTHQQEQDQEQEQDQDPEQD